MARAGDMQKKLTSVGLGMAGAVAANMAANAIPIPDPRLQAALPLVGGMVLMMMPAKNKMFAEVGLGMAIGGGLSTLKAVAPNMPFLAGDEALELEYLDSDDIPMLPEEIEAAMLEGEITPEEGEVLLEATGLSGEVEDYAGEVEDYAGEWEEGEYFEM